MENPRPTSGTGTKRVNARRIGDFSHDRVLLEVDDDHLGRVREIEPARGRIDRKDIPAAFAADGNIPLEFVNFLRGGEASRRVRRKVRKGTISSNASPTIAALGARVILLNRNFLARRLSRRRG